MNLLPKQYKKDLRLEAWRRYLLFLGLYLTVVLIGASALLLPSFFYLQFQIGELEKTRDAAKRAPGYEAMLKGSDVARGANRSLEAFDAYIKSKPAASPIIEEIIRRLPPEVRLTNIQYTRIAGGPTGTVKIVGEAAHRDNLRAFLAELQKSHMVTGKVSVPDTTFRKEFNTPFSLEISIKP